MLRNERYQRLARETIRAFDVELLQHPSLFPTLLSGVVHAKLGGDELVEVESAGGATGSSSAEQLAHFFTRPRAGLRCLVYRVHGTGGGGLE